MKKLTSKEWVNNARLLHKDKYDYSKIEYVNNKVNVCIICSEHGEFWQRPSSHLSGSGCLKCYHKSRTKNIEQFINDAIKIHGNLYDYSKVNYLNSSEKICIVCKEHGEFLQTPNSHLMNHGCPICNHSSMEKLIFNWLTKNNILFKSQYIIFVDEVARYTNKIIIDFFLVYNNKQYFIEYDGQQHFEYTPIFHKGGIVDFEKEQRRDRVLNEFCELHKDKVTLIRFNYKQSNEEIIEKLKEIINE